ncbi:MAG: lipid A biosynthesis acyltransferase [Deltaproteobacteria bacterium]|nr:lipid A biosynthesis acyltransferase [Deltaproteobacteria bacterium]
MSAHAENAPATTPAPAPPPAAPPPPEPVTWLNKGERGALLGIRAGFFVATVFGRFPARVLVRFIALWYRLFDRKAVRASRAWLERVTGEKPGFWAVYRHILRFAQVTLDRIFLLKGKVRSLRFTRTGHENLERQLATGRGAILLGAHLGSYEAMRYGGFSTNVPINILGYFANAKMVNALFEKLSPESAARVVHIGDDPVGVMVRVKERVAAGELVAVMGDRVGLSERVVKAEFFGEEAPFAAGPFLMAAVLKCPVYLVFGIYSEPNRYDLYCETFAESVILPRSSREEALKALVQRYADRLADHARKAPDNWFNFFDFWSSP